MNKSTSSNRLATYADVALAVSPVALGALASAASADVYSQTGLNITWNINSGFLTNFNFATVKMSGAGGATWTSIGVAAVQLTNSLYWNVGGALGAADIKVFQVTTPRVVTGIELAGSGATWDNLGRGTNAPGATATARYGQVFAAANSVIDPYNIGGAGDYFMLLRKGGNYGWVSFNASLTNPMSGSFTLTGWGWSDDGTKIAAGQTAASGGGGGAVPGLGGIAALACGAAGVRRKRDRVA